MIYLPRLSDRRDHRDTEVPPTLPRFAATIQLGLMFWFTRKKLSGSYLFLMETSRW